CLALVLKHFRDVAAPFPHRFPYYVLMELSDTQSGGGVGALAESVLEAALEEKSILDAAVAQNETQARAFWKLREFISEAQAHEGPNIKHDVSIPISRISEFIATTDAELERAYGGLRMVTFGHLGDGNLHYNVSAPEGVAPGVFVMHTAAINRIVHDSLARPARTRSTPQRFRGAVMTEAEFKRLAAQGFNRVPLLAETFADLETPLSLYLKLANRSNTYLLESVVGGERFGRYSFIGLAAPVRLGAVGGLGTVMHGGAVTEKSQAAAPLEFVRQFLSRY